MIVHLKIELPIPPSVNHFYRRARNGAVFKSDRAKGFTDLVGQTVAVEIAKRSQAPVLGRWKALRVRLEVSGATDIDVDNAMKVLQDGIARAFHFDDREITELIVRKRYGYVLSRCIVEIGDDDEYPE